MRFVGAGAAACASSGIHSAPQPSAVQPSDVTPAIAAPTILRRLPLVIICASASYHRQKCPANGSPRPGRNGARVRLIQWVRKSRSRDRFLAADDTVGTTGIRLVSDSRHSPLMQPERRNPILSTDD